MSPRVYLAGRYARKKELRTYALQIEALGHTDVSSWLWDERDELAEITELELVSDDRWLEVAQAIAIANLDDLQSADVSIHFSEAPHVGVPFGARNVELGMALSIKQQTKIVVGPREHLFHCLGSWMLQRVDSFAEAAAIIGSAPEIEART